MPGVIATIPKLQFSSLTGAPLAGGTLDVYLAGTTTRATTWQDSALSSANTNPVVLDSRGACVIWLNSTTAYKLVLKNSAGVSQWTQDNIVGGGVSGAIELAAAAIEAARTESAASAAAALATQTAINDIYYGARSSDPATKPSGAARAVGDEYFNTSAGLLKRWNGAGWQASDISTANLAAAGGVLLVGNATDKRDLAATGGAVLIGNKRAIASAATLTLAGWVESQTYCTADFAGIVSNGTGDNQAALSTIIGLLPIGARLRVKGVVRIATPLSIARRVSLWCDGADDALLVDVGVGNDGITYTGPAAGLNGLDVQLNVYGPANACKNAVVLDRVDRSKVFLNVRAGAAQYSAVYRGCLINRLHLESTVNYLPPGAAVGMAVDHLLIEKNTAFAVATNANDIWVNLEGARHGIVGTAQPGEGNNTYRGTIEGLSGRPFVMGNCLGASICDIHLEANALAGTFANCENMRVGPAVTNSSTTPLAFATCFGTTVDGYFGKLDFDPACVGTRLGQLFVIAREDITCNDASAESFGSVIVSGASSVPLDSAGSAQLENIFVNPYLDIWSNGPSAAPDGVALVGATATRSVSGPFEGNPAKVLAVVSVTGTTIADGANMTPTAPHNPASGAGFVSFAVPIFVPAGQPNVRVYLFNGSAYNFVSDVTAKGGWVVVRGSAPVVAGNAFYVALRCFNGTAFVAGSFSVGGCTITKGFRAPKFLADHGARSGFIVSSVGFVPAFLGQRAYLVATGKWYMAGGTATAADWLLLN
jgi:hypothetical protein